MPFLSLPTLSAKSPIGRSEYGRVKIALPPGKGLMDWVRLASSKILARKQMAVDHEELMKHNKRDDCWIHIYGQVYDVTSYLEFHPGGVSELMRAAGTDATDLFTQYHAWVNYENMLKSCFVGRFSGDLSKLPQPGPTTIEQPNSISAQLNALIMKGKQSGETYGINIFKSGKALKISSEKWNASNLRLSTVVIEVSVSKKCIRATIKAVGQSMFEIKWDDVFFDSESCTYTVAVQNNCVTIDFEAIEVETAVSPAKLSIKQSPLVVYHEGVIEEKRHISHDTLLFVVRLPRGLFYPVANGRHVSFKVRKGASVLYRPYTPVSSGSLSDQTVESEQVKCEEPARIVFMIKIYKDGICTPSLGALNIGDSIEISEPIGCVDMSPWTDIGSELLMLAAGTGLTPMVNIIRERLKRLQKEGSKSTFACNNTRLLLFNKSEEDIVSDDWLPMRWTDTQIATEHVLSNPSQEWDGRVGRIDSTMLPKAYDSLRVLICGPDGFNVAASKLLQDAGFRAENIHIFQG